MGERTEQTKRGKMEKETSQHPTAMAPVETIDEAGSQVQQAKASDDSQPASSSPTTDTLQPSRLRTMMETASGFWTKLNNDWIFNLAGLLAYNFLMALFPLLLLLLAACGLLLQIISPTAEQQLQQTVAAALPGSIGAILVEGVSTHLKRSAGLLLVLGLVAAVIAGSRLFVTLEGCFGIIFRLRGRDP